ncbi:MAG TPA: Fe-S cluster assembly protein SufD [Candidatus Dormibacteraeota bacterium]|nr:Fe-S cluster assembly protein SufD [Candidatus Dormibacteraeota bacterium]
MSATATIPHLQDYLAGFGELEQLAAGRHLPWLRELRSGAFARFCEAGFPTTHDEDWRFTSVAPLAQTPFVLADSGPAPSEAQLGSWRMPDAACELVFVNGRFAPQLSRLPELPAGVHAASLAAQIAENPASVEPHLGRYLDIRRDAFCALNTAFLEDGAYVRIGRGAVLERPIHLLFVSAAGAAPRMSSPRNLVVAEQNSQAAIVEDYVSLGGSADFCNTATELVAGDGAVVSHYLLEREHTRSFNISTLRIHQGRGANVASHSVLLGGAIVRNNVHAVLDGDGGDCLINGLFVGYGRQHLDNYMRVEHTRPHCSSRQFYNGILGDHARGVFHGRIIVHQDAQKTDAKQTNRNLLLSDDAQIDTKPQLEIYADDVKCTHGATIGQIEPEALFYLRSRGLEEAAARRLLLFAFANECLDRMRESSVRGHVDAMIRENLFPNAAGASDADAAAGIAKEGQ